MTNNYWQRFLYLEIKLKELSNYIQIDQKNFNVFSIELMSLYLSTCSEIEAIYKAISNKIGQSYNFDMFRTDFSSIADKDLLLEEVSFRNNSLKFNPFRDIESKKQGQFISIKWWKDHNLIKHNRELNFENATLENFLNSMSALYLLNLYFQYIKESQTSISPIPELFQTNKFYVDMRIGGKGFEYLKF
ncbi:hypothetical protein [Acinetobacter guillouiae]|uniref:hypothetical protein n=1 Tax=Acinetobacter guillouiae TaxID=106649 RepID=UPI003AF50A7D